MINEEWLATAKLHNLFEINMCKSEIFAEILSKVSEETEIPEQTILSKCRTAEVVDARCMLVTFLSEYGIYPVAIADLVGRTPANIRYLLATYENRKAMNKYLENNEQNIRKLMENKL